MPPLLKNPETGQALTAKEFDAAARQIADAYPLTVTEPVPEPSGADDGLAILLDRLGTLEEKDHAARQALGLRFDPNKPASEAAAEQGHRQPIPPVVSRPRPYRRRRPSQGPVRGESEGEVKPAGHEMYEPLPFGAAQDKLIALQGLRGAITESPLKVK